MSISLPPDDSLRMPWVSSIASGCFRFRAARQTIREVERRSDVLIVQLPFAAFSALTRPHTPRVYHVCANVRTIVSATQRYRGLKRLAAESLSRIIDGRQRRLIHDRSARIVTNGAELLRHYDAAERGRAVVSSTLLPEEVLSVPRTRPLDAPFRLLFVGFLRHEKGVDVLLSAFERLLDEIPNAELHIVGAKDLNDHGIGDQLKQALEKTSRRGTIQLHGHVPFGPALFRHYAEADVCVVPSRSEGTPRVLVEARAFGCPVVGSNIGGIPYSVEHDIDGLLVPPGDVSALTTALLRLARDAALRRRLIEAGVALAKRTTVDRFASALVEEAETVYQESQHVS